MRRLLAGVGANRLRDTGRLAIEHRPRRLRGHVPRRDTRTAGREHERSLGGELRDGGRDLPRLVGHDATCDLVTVAAQELGEQVAAPVFPRAGYDAVRNGQHRGSQTGSFVFSTSATSAIVISLSIAFAMSYT